VILTSRHPSPPLFPYTTLFRSRLTLAEQFLDFGDFRLYLRPAVPKFLGGDGGLDILLKCLFRVIGSQLSGLFDCVLEAAMFHERSEEHTSELQSRGHLVCRLLL